jgi:hypothetical protein
VAWLLMWRQRFRIYCIYIYFFLNPKNIKKFFKYESVFVAKLAYAVYASVSDPDAHSISLLDPDPGVNFALTKNERICSWFS